jgi:hypothetical protein
VRLKIFSVSAIMGFLRNLTIMAKFTAILTLFTAVTTPFVFSMIMRDCQNFTIPSQQGSFSL